MATMTGVIVAIGLFLTACQKRPVITHADYVHIPPSGWLSTTPLTFSPVYGDSALTYGFTLAVRHTNSYPYRNLPLVVDIIAADSSVNRKTLDIDLADEYGRWLNGGFGSLYQAVVTLADNVTPDQAQRIIVRQAMAGCDTLTGLDDVGIFVRPE